MSADPNAQSAYRTMENLMPKEYGFIKQGQLVAEMVAGFLAMPAEIVLHRHFGQRYLTPAGFVFFLVSLPYVVVFLEGSQSLRGNGGPLAVPVWFLSSPLRVFLLVCVGLSLWHFYEMWKRVRSGVLLHSRYSGTPYPFWWRVVKPLGRWMTVDELLVKRLAEPPAVILVGVVLFLAVPPLGKFVLGCGVCLLVKTQLEYFRVRGKVLDMLDGIAEGQAIRSFVQPGAASENAVGGYQLAGPPAARPVLKAAMTGPTVQESVSGLAKELRALMDGDAVPNGTGGEARPRATCPHCQRSGNLPENGKGKRVRCPGCRKHFTAS